MNDTVSGVLAGVLPKTVAPGSAAALMPDATLSGAFGFGEEEEEEEEELAAEAGPASVASGTVIAATPSSTAADSRVFPMRIMSVCTGPPEPDY
jgi:hypothetical protein